MSTVLAGIQPWYYIATVSVIHLIHSLGIGLGTRYCMDCTDAVALAIAIADLL